MLFSAEKIITKQTVGSTNDYLIDKIKSGVKISEGTVVIAWEQTNGKGMDDQVWESETGKNLTLSAFLMPQFLRAEKQFMLNKAISLGVCDFIKDHQLNHKVSIKWPNDIYIGDSKVAGILISNAITGNELIYSVIGIGVNVNQTKFSKNIRNPVSLKQIVKKEINLETALRDLLYWLDYRYEQLRSHQFEHINSDYISLLFRLNEPHFFSYNREIISARITGISDFGQLQLTTDNHQNIECDFKEIEFIITPSIP